MGAYSSNGILKLTLLLVVRKQTLKNVKSRTGTCLSNTVPNEIRLVKYNTSYACNCCSIKTTIKVRKTGFMKNPNHFIVIKIIAKETHENSGLLLLIVLFF